MPKHLLPFPSEFTIPIPVGGREEPEEKLGEKVDALLETLDVRWRWKASLRTGVGMARGNMWSRAARRQHLIKREGKGKNPDVEMEEADADSDDDDDDEDDAEAALGFKIQVVPSADTEEKGKAVEVKVRWLLGADHVLFESFCGMVKRGLAAPL